MTRSYTGIPKFESNAVRRSLTAEEVQDYLESVQKPELGFSFMDVQENASLHGHAGESCADLER